MFWILKSRYSEEGKEKLSIHAVNSHLDNIALKNANHDRSVLFSLQPVLPIVVTFPSILFIISRFAAGVETELEAMIRQMSPMEQKWLIRILLKDLRVSLSQKKVLNMFHPDANEQFDYSNNLRKVNTTFYFFERI